MKKILQYVPMWVYDLLSIFLMIKCNVSAANRSLSNMYQLFIITEDKRVILLKNPQEGYEILHKYPDLTYEDALSIVRL